MTTRALLSTALRLTSANPSTSSDQIGEVERLEALRTQKLRLVQRQT